MQIRGRCLPSEAPDHIDDRIISDRIGPLLAGTGGLSEPDLRRLEAGQNVGHRILIEAFAQGDEPQLECGFGLRP